MEFGRDICDNINETVSICCCVSGGVSGGVSGPGCCCVNGCVDGGVNECVNGSV